MQHTATAYEQSWSVLSLFDLVRLVHIDQRVAYRQGRCGRRRIDKDRYVVIFTVIELNPKIISSEGFGSGGARRLTFAFSVASDLDSVRQTCLFATYPRPVCHLDLSSRYLSSLMCPL